MIFAFDEVLIDHIVRSSPGVERALVELPRPARGNDGARQTQLIPTVRADVDGGFNVSKAAKILHVHPNAVVRLRRIRELTERDIRDPNQLLILFLALEHARANRTDATARWSSGPAGRVTRRYLEVAEVRSRRPRARQSSATWENEETDGCSR